jgi:hypothetical protein
MLTSLRSPLPSVTHSRPSARRLGALLIVAMTFAVAAPVAGAASHSPSRLAAPAPLARAAAFDAYSLSPADFHSIYALPKTGAAHQTIAIVSAFDDPEVQSDLNAYTKAFKIPACTMSDGCFRELNQSGAASPLPAPDPTGGTWLTESSVGTEVARGVCESCSIMLVEADAPTKYDLSTAVDAAARAGATVVVTAFSLAEEPTDSQYLPEYSHPGTVVVSASGDQGYNGAPYFPASLPDVIAVGGTQLNRRANGAYQNETAWSQTTSGCSLANPAPPWQASLAASVGCGSQRAVADLAAVAQPGALVHVQGVGSPCGSSLCEADGTSVSAPIIAGVIGLAGGLGSSEARLLYQHAHSDPGAFHDVTSGSTSNCDGHAICSARRGYDGPTGLGTPDGLGAFLASGGAIDRRHPALAVSAPRSGVRISSRWLIRVGLRNANPFAVGGSIAVTRRLRLGRALRTVTFAGAGFKLAPLAGATATLTIAHGYRQALKQAGSLLVWVSLRGVHGPAGAKVTVSKSLRLYAP